jgi:hypothetical protein
LPQIERINVHQKKSLAEGRMRMRLYCFCGDGGRSALVEDRPWAPQLPECPPNIEVLELSKALEIA